MTMHWISKDVAFGNRDAPREASGRCRSVINVANYIAPPYWDEVPKLHHDIWYFKLALPDRSEATIDYLRGLESVLDAIRLGGKLPVVCHCKMGGHRGPSAAVFAHWHLNGRTPETFAEAVAAVEIVKPGYSDPNHKRVYRNTLFDYCSRQSPIACNGPVWP